MNLEVVVLAAGNSTRMKSKVPKVLHLLGGKPLLSHVLDQAKSLAPNAIHVVVSESNQDALKSAFKQETVNWVLQEQQLGTGHAVMQALPHTREDATLLVLYGDVPRVRDTTLTQCVVSGENALTILSAQVSDPSGYGRILRQKDGTVTGIVEDRDLDATTRNVDEINSGIMSGPAHVFQRLLPKIERDNNQNELYLTDLVGLARTNGVEVQAVVATDEAEILGVNSRRQLAEMERAYQDEIADHLMDNGVTLSAPGSLCVRGDLTTGLDCTIDGNVQIEGQVQLGSNVSIGAGCLIKDATIGDDTRIYPQTIIDGAAVGEECEIGPSARLRPGAILHRGVRIGNFVEVKNATLEDGVKAGHLAYIGDAYIGANTNIGAGAITCNFDGVKKHRTVIGKNAFIGTNCSLVAPINIADGAFVAAGTTINKTDIDEDHLVVGRPDLKIIPNWSKRSGSQADKT